MSLLIEMAQKAATLGVPISVHLDITYRCNERCPHCYLDHDDHGEMTTEEIKELLNQLAEAGTFFLTLSGGEVLMRRDFFELVEHARRLLFNVKVKTNGVMIRGREAQRMRRLGVEQVQISIYSHRPEVHDAITKLPGSLKRSLQAIRLLKTEGLKVTIANVLMAANAFDNDGVIALAQELGASYMLDPMVTPKMDGDCSVLELRAAMGDLQSVFHDQRLAGSHGETCGASTPEDVADDYPCSAGHASCYISPYGDVFPCVQFPLPSGNVRRQRFLDIWQGSPELAEVRSIRTRDLHGCSSCSNVNSCSRCPGLAYMEGNMRGPSTTDCQISYLRTGVVSSNLLNKSGIGIQARDLVQIKLAARA